MLDQNPLRLDQNSAQAHPITSLGCLVVVGKQKPTTFCCFFFVNLTAVASDDHTTLIPPCLASSKLKKTPSPSPCSTETITNIHHQHNPKPLPPSRSFASSPSTRRVLYLARKRLEKRCCLFVIHFSREQAHETAPVTSTFLPNTTTTNPQNHCHAPPSSPSSCFVEKTKPKTTLLLQTAATLTHQDPSTTPSPLVLNRSMQQPTHPFCACFCSTNIPLSSSFTQPNKHTNPPPLPFLSVLLDSHEEEEATKKRKPRGRRSHEKASGFCSIKPKETQTPI